MNPIVGDIREPAIAKALLAAIGSTTFVTTGLDAALPPWHCRMETPGVLWLGSEAWAKTEAHAESLGMEKIPACSLN